MRLKLLLPMLLFCAALSFPQAGSYYNSINTSSPTFISDLETRIRVPYTKISYDQYDETNVANFASFPYGNGRAVYCVYSHYLYTYNPPFSWGVMSREHTWCHSWMPTYSSQSGPEYSDQYHLFPTEQNNANGRRSNHPLGVVSNVTFQFLEGKLGTNTSGDIVYEPRDQHKGDAARAILYMCIKYDGVNGNTWNFNWLNNTRLPSINEGPQDLATLIAWHKQDPPDKWEVDRNNYIQSIQQNRNPLVDHPEYLNYIDFNNLSKLNPSYAVEPANYVTNLSAAPAANSITLNWTDAAAGTQTPSGYLLVGYNADNYFLPIDGEAYNNDTDFSDGKAVVNVAYSDIDSYTFSNLVSQKSYYFTVYSYNGDGASRNYKIDGTLQRTNATTGGSAATIVAFTQANATVGEGSGTYNLNVSISNPSATIPTTVEVALISGSASDINNYTTQTVTFPANSTAAQVVPVTITDDNLPEADESFTFALQNVSGGTDAQIGSPNEFDLIVTDNDATTLKFASSSGTTDEGAGTINIPVTIDNPSNVNPATVQVVLSAGDSTDLDNYTTQTLTFPAGSSAAQNLVVNITDDMLTEGTESFDFTLTNPSGGNTAFVGTPGIYTLSINDNDISGDIVLLDNFDRADNTTVGNTPTPITVLTWNETETTPSTGAQVSNNMLKLASTTIGEDYTSLNMGQVSGFPVQLNNALDDITWAFNFKQTRENPSGFDNNNYGMGFLIASSSDLTGGSGYGVVLGNSGTADPLRFAKFNGGANANSKFTNIISSGDYGMEYLSVKLVFHPSTSTWDLYGESGASAFPQTDPRNTATLLGSAVDNTYTGSALNYLTCLWNHASGASDNAVFDDIYISDPGASLPVELASFVGTATNASVALKWETASELNNYGFDVERSADKQQWAKIGFIKGAGSNTSSSSYSFTDDSPLLGKSWYRLKQLDENGTGKYSGVVEIDLSQLIKTYALQQNYPNPFNPSTTISYSIPQAAGMVPVQLKVYDLLGNLVTTLVNEKKGTGNYNIVFDASRYSSGVYFYELRAGDFVSSKKMILMK